MSLFRWQMRGDRPTTGRNAFGDGVASARPSLMTGVSPSACNTSDLIYEAGYGCFNLNPAPGTPTIERNFGRGPATVMINMRISRTWSFGKPAEPNPNGMGGMGGPGGGGPPGGGGGGYTGHDMNMEDIFSQFGDVFGDRA